MRAPKLKAPNKIRVGYRDYRVVYWPKETAEKLDKLGECDSELGVIHLSEGMEPQQMANTLFHEVLHAVWYVGAIETGLPQAGDEEKIVTIFSNVLMQVFRDNPELYPFILDCCYEQNSS